MIKLILFTMSVAMMAVSCGKDSCAQKDWVGTYNTTTVCTGEDPEVGTISITAGANDDEIVVDGEVTATIDGCMMSGSETITDDLTGIEITITVDGELDDDNITMNLSADFFGITTTCTSEGAKN